MSALLLFAAAAASSLPEHRVRVVHPAGPAEVVYRGVVRVSMRQVGAAGPGGRPSSLACRWSADLHVRREATGAAGSAHRALPPRRLGEGRYAGWCDGRSAAAEREAATILPHLPAHLAEAAEHDRPTLLAELDRLSRSA